MAQVQGWRIVPPPPKQTYCHDTVQHHMRKYCAGAGLQNKALQVIRMILGNPKLTLEDAEHRRFYYWLTKGKLSPCIVTMDQVAKFLRDNDLATDEELKQQVDVYEDMSNADIYARMSSSERQFIEFMLSNPDQNPIDEIVSLKGNTVRLPVGLAWTSDEYLELRIDPEDAKVSMKHLEERHVPLDAYGKLVPLGYWRSYIFLWSEAGYFFVDHEAIFKLKVRKNEFGLDLIWTEVE